MVPGIRPVQFTDQQPDSLVLEFHSHIRIPEIRPENIRHIFFDLDHTLWDFDTNSRDSLEELLVQYRGQIGEDISLSHFMQHYREVNGNLWDQYRRNHIHQEELRLRRFPETFDRLGITPQPWMNEFADAYLEDCPRRTHLMPQAMQTLQILSEKFGLHIITNGFSKTQFIKLKYSGLESLFQNVVTSESAGAKKPDPKIFQFALHAASADPESSLYIGDEFEVDVLGGLGSGIPVIFFNPDQKSNDLGVSEVKSLAQILEMLNISEKLV